MTLCDSLLTHGYFLAEDPKEQRIMKPYAPLGILYLSSSHLRAQDFDVEVYDSTFGVLRRIDGNAGGAAQLVAIGIYGNLMTRANVIRNLPRRKGGGLDRHSLAGLSQRITPRNSLAAGADLIVKGEAERFARMRQLMRANFERAAWASIPGLIFVGGKQASSIRAPRN